MRVRAIELEPIYADVALRRWCLLYPDIEPVLDGDGRTYDEMDGLNVHFAAIDEVHEHATPEIIRKLNTATGARRQPVIFEVTTAGHDRHSVCRQHHQFSRKALEAPSRTRRRTAGSPLSPSSTRTMTGRIRRSGSRLIPASASPSRWRI